MTKKKRKVRVQAHPWTKDSLSSGPHDRTAKEVDIAGQHLVEGSLVDEMERPRPPERPQLLRDMDLSDGIANVASAKEVAAAGSSEALATAAMDAEMEVQGFDPRLHVAPTKAGGVDPSGGDWEPNLDRHYNELGESAAIRKRRDGKIDIAYHYDEPIDYAEVRAMDKRTGIVITKDGRTMFPRKHPAAARAKRIAVDQYMAWDIYNEILRTLSDRRQDAEEAIDWSWRFKNGGWPGEYWGSAKHYFLGPAADDPKSKDFAEIDLADQARTYTSVLKSLQDHPPIWIDPLMWDLAMAEAPKITDEMIDFSAVPTLAGMLLLPTPHDFLGIECAAIVWVIPEHGDPSQVVAFRHLDDGVQSIREAQTQQVLFVLIDTEGKRHLPPMVITADFDAYGPEVRQMVRETMSVWLLARSRFVDRVRAEYRRPAIRRLSREFPRAKGLEVITLRKRAAQAKPRTDEPGVVDWQYQWQVRPHLHNYWKKDPVTGERKLTPVYVDSYFKGPADKPVKIGPTIYHLKR